MCGCVARVHCVFARVLRDHVDFVCSCVVARGQVEVFLFVWFILLMFLFPFPFLFRFSFLFLPFCFCVVFLSVLL